MHVKQVFFCFFLIINQDINLKTTKNTQQKDIIFSMSHDTHSRILLSEKIENQKQFCQKTNQAVY